MRNIIRLIMAGLALALVMVGLAPSASAAQTNRITAGRYGSALYVDTNGATGGYHWKRFEPGTTITNDSNNRYKTSGKSAALIRGIYRVACYNQPEGSVLSIPTDEDDAILAGYKEKDCKNTATSSKVENASLSGGRAAVVAPASVGHVNWTCLTSSWYGGWHAKGYRNNKQVWTGEWEPLRSWAVDDCKDWLADPYVSFDSITTSITLGSVATTLVSQTGHMTSAVGPMLYTSERRDFTVNGHFLKWYSNHYIGGEWVGSAGPFKLKASATHEGICWAAGC